MIVKQELRFQLKSFLLWTLILAGLLLLFFSLYPTFEAETASFKKALEALPETMLKAFNFDIDAFFTIGGFLAYYYHFINVALAVCGILWGLVILGREKKERMFDFLLVKPQARLKIFMEKFLAGLILIFLLNLLLYLLSYFALRLFTTSKDFRPLASLLLGGLILHVFFYCFGSFLAVVIKRLKNPSALANGIALVLYLMTMLAQLAEFDFILSLSPFSRMDPSHLVNHGLELKQITLFFSLAFLFIFLAQRLYCQKDLEV